MTRFTSTTTRSASRRWMAALLVLAGLSLAAASQAATTTITKLTANTLPGDGLQVRVNFTGPAPRVKGYSIEKPARIALDLMGAQSALKLKDHDLGAGNARSVAVVQAKDRTRMIFSLDQIVAYKTKVDGQQLVINLGGKQASQIRASTKATAPMAAGDQQIKNIDFRRGKNGSGRLVVKLSDPSIPVDVRQDGNKIVARFVGAGIADDLVRRLDVSDFATPVHFVDTKEADGSTVITIEPEGTWDYLAYQADNEFSINVKPLTKDQKQQQKNAAFKYTGEKLSLNFQDIEVRSVLQLIADFTDLNLVASDTVKGKITLRLQNVPWDQALDLILKTKGLDKRKVGNVLLVAPADEIAAREEQELKSQKQMAELAPLRTQYMTVNYAKAEDLQKLITAQSGGKGSSSLLSARGSVAVDKRTNTLIVQDTAAKIDNIRGLLKKLDVPVRQVLIEARVVIASTNVDDEFGVRWGGLGINGKSFRDNGRSYGISGRLQSLRDLHNTNFQRQTTSTTTATSSSSTQKLNWTDVSGGNNSNNDMIVDMGVDAAQATRFAIGFTSMDSGLIELELSALQSEGHGEVVATPKVLTADHQPAVIASGQQVAVNKSTSSGATAVQFIKAELRLEVTPQVTPDGDVIMQLKVNKDSLGSSATPTINTNRVETTVLVNNGETVVLGGIFQQEKVKSVIKTPFLGDIPWLGALFRKKVSTDTKQELLIFITPRLVKDTSMASR